MIRSKLGMMAVVASLLAVLVCSSGCNPLLPLLIKWKTPEAFIPDGAAAEIRRPIVVPIWVHDKSGKASKAYFTAYPGCLIAPAAPTK